MPLYTKPCSRIGCYQLCKSITPSQHARKRFCSNHCAAKVRSDAGYRIPITEAQRIAAGRKGGQMAGRSRRKRAALAEAAHLSKLIPSQMADRLGPEDVARVKVLLARAVRFGRIAERSRLREAAKQRFPEETRGGI